VESALGSARGEKNVFPTVTTGRGGKGKENSSLFSFLSLLSSPEEGGKKKGRKKESVSILTHKLVDVH